MSTIFDYKDDDENDTGKINMDELYEKKHHADLSKLNVYNKILNRIHKKIKTLAKQDKSTLNCWYLIPEVILGVPLYDQSACITYVMEKLENNGFIIKYIHPNLVFISWQHWVPAHVRKEIKNKTGVNVDGFGNVVEDKQKNEKFNLLPKTQTNQIIQNNQNTENKDKIVTTNKKEFKPIANYKPSGKFIYDNFFD
jgi:hypothetical protein